MSSLFGIRSAAVASACVLIASATSAQQASVSADSAELAATLRAVGAIDSALAVAETRGDTASMRIYFAKGYYSVAPDGEMLSARARLNRIARGVKATDSTQTLTRPWIRRLSSDAVLVTRSTRIWGVRHGAEVSASTFRVTRLYVREGHEWRLLFQQGSPLAEEHVAGRGPGAPPYFPP